MMAGSMKDALGDVPYLERYPERPGWKATDTSRAASIAIGATAAAVRLRTLAAIKAAPGGLTADEAAANIGESILTVRPRVAELRRYGQVMDSGARRRNVSGHTAIVWTSTTR